MPQKHATVVILGAGIGGYYAFTNLKKTLLKKNKQSTILLIDRKPYSQFLPIMHQLVSHRICPTTARALFSDITSNRSETLQSEVLKINTTEKIVETTSGPITYQKLIVALGSELHYYDTPGAKDYSFRVNDLNEATKIRDALDAIIKQSTPSFITIVGGSYTGVEVAGEVATRLKKYPQHTVQLVDGRDKIISTMSDRAQKLATKRLLSLRVKIIPKTRVLEVGKDYVNTDSNGTIPSQITIWAGGCKNTGKLFFPESEQKNERVVVDEYLRISKLPDVYAIGDISAAKLDNKEHLLPQNGSVAHEQAKYVSHHITSSKNNKQIKPFSHKTGEATVMSVGAWYGVATFGKITIGGVFPWLMRQAIYILFVPTTKNKLRFLKEFWTGS